MSDKALPIPAWLLTIAAMFSVQLGSALSMPMIDALGTGGTAWLRLSWAALIFLAISRPKWSAITRQDLPVLMGLGITTGIVTMAFLGAIDRIPLGASISIEFLGPLTVATLRSKNPRARIWPIIAFGGVLLLTKPWEGSLNLVGVALALVAAVGWATYILLTSLIGDRYEGLTGLAITMPISALTAGIFGAREAIPQLTTQWVLAGLGLALLLPVIPYALELISLRRMSQAAFGTLMALEPAFGVLLGALLLAQPATIFQVVGVALVVAAGIATQLIDKNQAAVQHVELSE